MTGMISSITNPGLVDPECISLPSFPDVDAGPTGAFANQLVSEMQGVLGYHRRFLGAAAWRTDRRSAAAAATAPSIRRKAAAEPSDL